MDAAHAITRKGGEIICVGLGSFEDRYEYAHSVLVSEERVLRGCYMGSGVAARDIPLHTRFFLDGLLPVDRLKSGTCGFSDLNAGFDALDRGMVLRQILLPNG